MRLGLTQLLAGGAAALLMAHAAMAGQPLVLETDKTSIISVSADPGTVVIGNPAIADVTVNGKQIFLHGHAFGDTNLIILDVNGNQIANFDITVSHNTENALALYKPSGRTSFTCAPLCEATMQTGDPTLYTQDIVKTNQSLNEIATGKKSADTTAPVAPQ